MDLGKYGPWALIVGGSEGIGSACARQLAAAGFNIAVVARKIEPLEALAEELRGMGVEARALSVDLADARAIDKVRTITDDIDVGLMIYNAGANKIRGDFLDLDESVYRDVINITVVGQAEFTRHYGALMKARGKGGIILGGSSSNFCGAPTLAPYTAAKSFSRILSESLWIECQPVGIDVLHMSIGYTDTPAMQRAGYDTSTAQAPEEVAAEVLANIANGPLLILGGQQAYDLAVKRSQLEDRGAVIRSFATPRRDDIPQKA